MSSPDGKQRILAAARSLFLEKGYNASSVDEICERANITKGSFFYHFKDKEALGLAAVHYHMQVGQEMLMKADFMQEPEPLKKLIAYIDFMIRSTNNPVESGCLLGVFSEELACTKPSIINVCGIGFDQWEHALVEMIEAAKKRHRPRARLDSHGLAQHFLATYEGAIILVKAGKPVQVIQTTLEHYKTYLKKQILGK